MIKNAGATAILIGMNIIFKQSQASLKIQGKERLKFFFEVLAILF